jgi:hypothetical protein
MRVQEVETQPPFQGVLAKTNVDLLVNGAFAEKSPSRAANTPNLINLLNIARPARIIDVYMKSTHERRSESYRH